MVCLGIFWDGRKLNEHHLSIMSNKGSVTVWSQRGRLHLRFRFEGKQHRPALGLDDDPLGWAVAKGIAAKIEGDLKTQNFDPTLAKYGIGLQRSGGVLTLAALIERYLEAQRNRLDPDGLAKFRWIRKDLEGCGLLDTPCNRIDRDEAAKLIRHLQARGLKLRTIRHRVEALGTAWRWALGVKLLTDPVPWVSRDVVGIPTQPHQPFTTEEIRAILAHLDGSPIGPIIRFSFATGCRSGEAIGLLWRHLGPNCESVWFGESITGAKRTRKIVKNRKPRQVTLPASLRSWLLRYRESCTKTGPDDLVFPNPKGIPFTAAQIWHPWRRALKELGIPYRKPYTTRKTLISHALAQGKNPVEIASLTGHTVQVLLTHYADLVAKPELIDLLD